MGHANDIASLADGAVAELKDDLARVIAALIEHVAALLREGKPLDAEIAAKLQADFTRLLGEVGYDQAVEKVAATFEQVAQANAAHVRDTLGASFTTANRESLGAFVTGVVDDLVRLKGDAGAALKEAVLRAGVATLPVEEQVAKIVEAAELKLHEAIAEVDTSLMAFHREALISSAENAGIDLFTYDGPFDDITRPFCDEHILARGVGRIYTTGDLDAEDNGQGLSPTSRFLGGYHCRHSLSPLSRETAATLLEQHGDRVVGGTEARRIVLGDTPGPNERAWVEQHAGDVVTRGGQDQVVRRRRRSG